MSFVGILILFPVGKEFLKSVKIVIRSLQSSAANFKGAVLFEPLCISCSPKTYRHSFCPDMTMHLDFF